MTNKLKYNILSLLSLLLGFLFIVYIGRKFGAGSQADMYFLSMVVITYLGYFVQCVWEAMSPYYAEYKIKDKELSDRLYSILLNGTILASFFIIFLFFIVTHSFDLFEKDFQEFLNIFIFYLTFQNILFINKGITNLEHLYASYYLVDIFINLILCVAIIFFITNEILYIAYAIISATFLSNIWQFYLIFIKKKFNYSFIFYDKNLSEIYKNSFKLKAGSLLYGSKDIIIAHIFTGFGAGYYSLYSYATKFSGVIFKVISAPILNIFLIKSQYNIANKRYHLIKEDIKKTLIQTTILFIFASVATYFILPVILNGLFGDKFSITEVLIIQNIFSVMTVYGLLMVLEQPFGRTLVALKQFNFSLKINCLYAILFAIGAAAVFYMNIKIAIVYLSVLIFIHMIIGIIIFTKFKRLMSGLSYEV